jgi:hypothetical protein
MIDLATTMTTYKSKLSLTGSNNLDPAKEEKSLDNSKVMPSSWFAVPPL